MFLGTSEEEEEEEEEGKLMGLKSTSHRQLVVGWNWIPCRNLEGKDMELTIITVFTFSSESTFLCGQIKSKKLPVALASVVDSLMLNLLLWEVGVDGGNSVMASGSLFFPACSWT